jgi:membrane protease YdiL (CAAX protease family)
VGIAFSSLLFGAFHVQADLVSWAFVGAVTALYGVVFALLRVWSNGRIAASIVAHMVVNAMAIVVVVLTG